MLPGVGAFADCRRGLDAVPGMVEALNETRAQQGPAVPRHLRRHAADGRARPRIRGDRRASAGFRGEVDQIAPADPALKIPHMGWNTLDARKPHPLLDGIPLGPTGCTPISCTPITSSRRDRARPRRARPTTAGRSPRSSARDNMVGTQFHPEKSQQLGLALIANFLKWKP